jgi:voltage-gated potassium channel
MTRRRPADRPDGGSRPARLAVPRLQAVVRRRRMTGFQALALVAACNAVLVLGAAVLMTHTDPLRFPDVPTGIWWAVTTITTVGYGDVVPVTGAGRVVAGVLMFVGIGSFAFLTAVAASFIVVGEVGAEERLIEQEEAAIRRTQMVILARLRDISTRLERLERTLSGTSPEAGDTAGYAGGPDRQPHGDRRAAGGW